MKLTNIEILTLNKKGITDFAKERNLLLNKSKSVWILFLDTDERVTSSLMKEILKRVQDDKFSGFYIKRKIYFCGQYAGEDRVLRLAKRNSGKWVRAVHETWNVKGDVGTLDNYIIHNTANSVSEYVDKINFYSTLHAKENKKEGKESNLFKIIIYPNLKFVQNLLTGRGIVFSMMQAMHSYLSWVKLWEIQNN